MIYQLYTHVAECEMQVLTQRFQLQAESIENGDQEMKLFESLMDVLSTTHTTLFKGNEWIFDLLENFFQVAYWTRKCDSTADYLACIALSFKLITGKAVSKSVIDLFKKSDDNLQGMLGDFTRDARDIFSTAEKVVDNPIVSKLRLIYTYLLVNGFLKAFGKELSTEEYMILYSKSKHSFKEGVPMIMLIIDTSLTLLERYEAYVETGDWKALLGDSVQMTQWLKTADRLISLAPFTSNLVPHGTTYFSFISDLSDAIEKGEAMCKYSAKANGSEMFCMRKKLNSLQMLKNIEVTRRSSQQERRAPWGVLIHGTSSVAKSTFTKMLYYYYGKVHGLDIDDHYRYVRSPTDEYWSNFDSSKWCVQFDDIAFMLPSKSPDVDATLKDMLNVINNVPYVPPQAALEDKGRTPVLAKLVLATTNAPDLNALEYFHCPLAVRRRLPYVIKVEPKQEYLHANGKFIEPTKLPAIDSSFPDFWNITVQKLEPIDHNGRDSAKLETVAVFTDVKEFLKHFAKESFAHEANQDKSQNCDTKMKDIPVCTLCYCVKEDCHCLQAGPVVSVLATYLASCVAQMCCEIFCNLLSMWFCIWLVRFAGVRRGTAWLARFMDAGYEIRINNILNTKRNVKFKLSLVLMLKFVKLTSTIFVVYKVSKHVMRKTLTVPAKPVVVEEVEEETLDPQGNVMGTTEQQLVKETTNNVWYNSSVELSSFDLPKASGSLVGKEESDIRDMFCANCVNIIVENVATGKAIRMGGVFVKGQYMLFNRHAMGDGQGRFKIKIVSQTVADGLSPNIVVYANRDDIVENVEKDVAMLRVNNTAPKKDITKFWNNGIFPITKMLYVRRDPAGFVEHFDVFNVMRMADFPIECLASKTDIYMGQSMRESKNGDCGSIAIATTPKGPVIMGIHTVGYQRTYGAPHLTLDELEAMIPDEVVISDGNMPKLSLNGDVTLLTPHTKCISRYFPKGVAKVYGSLPGFRPKMKSKVCATPLQEEMLDHFQIKVEHGKPIMDGWEPHYNNVKEMIKPYTDIDETVVDHCVEAFTADILKGLTEAHGDAWKGELVFLTDAATVNGLPGVKFIDAINKNTSMGFPWNTTKKKYLEECPTEIHPDGVDFGPEVWDEVRAIEAKYAQSERAYPIFAMHDKDEAVTLAKIDAKKTRLFAGAPVPWSLVVRKHLLSFVRLVQKNKFVFEAAPGVCAQSKSWTEIYAYLTQHGEDQIVGGDYGKFDKRMLALLMLAAFRIIIRIHLEAGFTPEEMKPIFGIAIDTSFPLCNLSGLLIEFIGTNPSGHPLTVILNSLVNSIYMRYAYAMLNPDEKKCWSFKQFVALLTYGDDNGMGVSKRSPWFNHTAIQKVLSDIGVEYTMADKESESVPYIHISKFAFLKRSWRWEIELGLFTCPLEEASIHKSLTVWLPSGTIDKYDQMVAVIVSANNEYFFHGKEIFEQHHKFFKELLAREPYSLYASDTTLPNWDTLLERFRSA